MDVELYKAAKQGKVEFLGENSPMITNEESASGSGTRTNGEYFLSKTHEDKNNIIHLAARQGHTSFIQKALEQFSTLYNQANSRDDTPLHIAARFGHYSVVELLVSHYNAMFPQQEEDGVTNAETNPMPRREIEDGLPPLWRAVNSEGITALDEALRNRHEKVALFLLRQDPEMACCVNGVEESPLYLAAESRCEEVMKEILNSNLPYKDQGPHGQNALHAAKYCTESSIDLLLRKRPTLVKGVDNHGKSALHYAIQTDQVWLITLLLKVDTSIAYLSDADGITPLLKASSRGNLYVCRTILKLCPDSIEARNRNGQNVVHLFKGKYPRRVRLFLKIPEVMELINERDDEGNTALHLAIQNHDFMKAAVLIRTKVDLRITNKEGLTVLDVCESEWKTSYKQRRMWFLLKLYNATRGRHPNQSNVPIAGPLTTYIEDDADWKQLANTLSVVAALLTTVTFTAVFTIPGGYNSSGNAVLMKKAALQAFVLSDTFAMCTSITVVFFLIWAMIGEPELLRSLTNISLQLLKLALYGTLVAFVTGLYAVTASDALWVIILVFIMVTIVPCIVSRYAVMSLATDVWITCYSDPIARQRRAKRKRHRRLKRNLSELKET